MIKLILSLLIILSNSLKIENKVFLHVEKFYKRARIYHVGISFKNHNKLIRFDFQGFDKDNIMKTYSCNDAKLYYFDMPSLDQHKINDNAEFEKLLCIDNFNYLNKNSKLIYFGDTCKSQEELIDYGLNYLNKKKYILGIYDCRHYVNEFSQFALNKSVPIWKLHRKYGF